MQLNRFHGWVLAYVCLSAYAAILGRGYSLFLILGGINAIMLILTVNDKGVDDA